MTILREMLHAVLDRRHDAAAQIERKRKSHRGWPLNRQAETPGTQDHPESRPNDSPNVALSG
jgi:hypothetical protein